MKWSADGSICPGCGGAGRNSMRYPAALCHSCEEALVDERGRKGKVKGADAEAGAASWGTGVVIEVEGQNFPENTPIFLQGIECGAREAHFGGIVVQPVEAWDRKRE